MAFTLNYTDHFNDNYPTAYFSVASFSASLVDGLLKVVFNGYADASRKGKRVIGQKEYLLPAGQFAAFMQSSLTDIVALQTPNTIQSLRDAFLAKVYAYAAATADCSAAAIDTRPAKGQPAVSFFLNATAS